MAKTIENIVAELPGMADLSTVMDLAEARLADGDAEFVADLGIALHRRYGKEGKELRQYRGAFDFLLQLLAVTPGQRNIEQALRLAAPAKSGRSDKRGQRLMASLLASCQSAEDLAVVFAGGSSHAGGSEELRACLVHELILRGVDVRTRPGVSGWAASRHWRYHPLGQLPLERAAFEVQPDLPSYHAHGGSCAMPYAPSSGGPATVADPSAHVPTAIDTTTESAATAIATAVSNWAEESNGRIEARTYDLMEPVSASALPGLLESLQLDSLRGMELGDRAIVSSCSAVQAWRVVFAAASTGGAYNYGLHGAYGRLAAWRTLAGLSGALAHTSPAEVAQQILDCDWFTFEAASTWFERVAWDLGLVAIAPDRHRVAVLAATDTD